MKNHYRAGSAPRRSPRGCSSSGT